MTHPKYREGFEEGYASIFWDAKRGLRDALDLVLIHNERDVRGEQPRSTLNPLTLLLAVAAWERFVSDCGALLKSFQSTDGEFTIKPFAGPGLNPTARGTAYLRDHNGQAKSGSVYTLSTLTDGKLPEHFCVQGFMGWAGKRLTNPVTYEGYGVAVPLEEAIRYRNGVAHRALPQQPAISDAKKSTTIQSGYARAVLALVLQLINQSSILISEINNLGCIYRLNSEWFQTDPRALRGYENPGRLWPIPLIEKSPN